MHLVQPY
ncbi:hypothetical protein D043_2329A, partial [Vibrio parahaemolyticus EKP-021]